MSKVGHPEGGRQVGPLVLESLDYVWNRVRTRVEGLGQDEYLWEPVSGCWSVRRTGDGWQADHQRPEPEPAPVTTIAWRLWHIGSTCLASYTERGLGPPGSWPLAVHGTEWYGEVGEALTAMDTAWAAFRAGLAALGEDGMWRPLGERWGIYAKDTRAALAVHALDEVSHHGAEMALLRDLYLRRASA